MNDEEARFGAYAREDLRLFRRRPWSERLGEFSNVITGLGGAPASRGRAWIFWFLSLMLLPVLVALAIAYPEWRMGMLVACIPTLMLIGVGIKGMDYRINRRNGLPPSE